MEKLREYKFLRRKENAKETKLFQPIPAGRKNSLRTGNFIWFAACYGHVCGEFNACSVDYRCMCSGRGTSASNHSKCDADGRAYHTVTDFYNRTGWRKTSYCNGNKFRFYRSVQRRSIYHGTGNCHLWRYYFRQFYRWIV